MNLIYTGISCTSKYVEMLHMLLSSIYKYTGDDVEVIVLTHDYYTSKLTKIDNVIELPTLYNDVKLPRLDLLEATMLKIRLFEAVDTSKYNNILYLDVDVLVTDFLNKIFIQTEPDRLHCLAEGYITPGRGGNQWGSNFFPRKGKHVGLPGLNSGVMLFKPTKVIEQCFNSSIDKITQHVHARRKLPGCLEQPFINYCAILPRIYEINKLAPFAMIHRKPEPESDRKIINHFVGWIGNYDYKYKKMKKFYDQYIGDKK